MNPFQRANFLVAVTVAAVVGAAFATLTHGRRRRVERDLQHGKHLKAWENEGGNLAPPPATAVPGH
jgi:hypothetical protein